MPEGELATLLPIPPGALLNPTLLFLLSLFCIFHFSSSFSSHSPTLLFLFLSCYVTDLTFFSCLSLSFSLSPLSLSSFTLDDFFSSSLSVSSVSYKALHHPPASAFPLISSLHVGVDDILALHMTVPANWAKVWRRAGGQGYSLPVHDEDTCHASMVSLSSPLV